MASVKVPPENYPVFLAALPKDPRVETLKMFGGVAAKVNGNVFAGLFGQSTMILLPEAARARALALEGASTFDPIGNGRARSNKVMLPASMMKKPAELRRWLVRAFDAAAEMPPKAAKAAAKKTARKSSDKKPKGGATTKKASANRPRKTGSSKAVAPVIAGFLQKYTPAIQAQLGTARGHLRAMFPRGFELVFDNYNALVFGFSPSEHARDSFVSVAGYPQWVTLFFLNGAALADPRGLLEGSGKQVRSIRLKDAADIDDRHVRMLIARSMAPHAVALSKAPPLETIVKTVVTKHRPRRPASKTPSRRRRSSALERR